MHVEDETILRKVHFFDGCEDLEMSDDLRDLLNSKLSKIDNDFKTKMKQLQKINNESYTKLLKFKILNDGAFSLEEMNA